MEIRTLRYFLAVAREENMSKAAEILHISQPALSKVIRSLEEELGKKLFIRHSFSIELTDEGILLRDRAEDLVGMADKIEQEFLFLDDISSGDLYFGLAESYQVTYLARQIALFKKKYPGLHYHVSSGDTEQVTEKLDKGLLDFALICETPDRRKYECIALPKADVFGLVMRKDSPLAEKSCVTPSDLKGLPLFCSEQSWKNDIAPWAGDIFSEYILEGSFRLSYNGSLFAKEGLGYLLTFEHLIDTSRNSGLCFRPLSPSLKIRQYLIWNRFQAFTPIARRFLEEVRSIIPDTEKAA